MFVNELLGLHEHATRTAARIVNASPARLEHLHQHVDDALGRVELTAALAFGASKPLEEILIHLAEQVAGTMFATSRKACTIEKIDQLTQATLIEVIAVIDARQRAGKRGVSRHHLVHGLIDELADVLSLLSRGR